jgi:RimJ/RimL family protein N-acetyltransferase
LNYDFIIRKAITDDLETLLRFEQEVITTERPFDPTLKPGPNFYYDLKQMMKDPLVHLVIAEYNSELIGSGYARIEKAKPYLQHDRHAYLGFMYVVPEWRGNNVNQLIIENLKQWAITKGIHELRLEVYVESIPAIRAYEKAGFSKLMVEMRMGMENDE